MNKKILTITPIILLGLLLVACKPQTVNAPTKLADIEITLTLTVTVQPTEAPFTATAIPTETPVSLASVDGGMSAKLVLSNASDRNIEIYWLDTIGDAEFAKRLTPGQSYTQDTFVDHAWRVRDEASGEIIKDIVVKSRDTNLPIIIPSSIASLPTLEPTPTAIPVLVENGEGCEITDNGSSLLSKTCSANGIDILASDDVRDQALQQAWYIISNMIASRPDIHEYLANIDRANLLIIGANQDTTDISHMMSLGNAGYWNDRLRGWGGTKTSPETATAEENLLCWSSDRWFDYNVTIHEFAHTIHMIALSSVEPEFGAKLDEAFLHAKEAGLWQDAYAGTNQQEYWAEGVTMYFGGYGWNIPENDYINTKIELQEYDPDLYNLIVDTFRGLEWTPECP